MASIERLTAVSDPFFATIAEAKDVAAEARGWLDSALVVRAVRGRKVRTRQALFDEVAAALQFPYYFGENWSAFEDCISDLDWLPFQHGVVVVVYGANEVLADEPETDLVTLIGAFSSAAADFGRVVADGEWWDRGPVPFHVVLQGASADEFERWRAAGAEIAPLPLGGRGG